MSMDLEQFHSPQKAIFRVERWYLYIRRLLQQSIVLEIRGIDIRREA